MITDISAIQETLDEIVKVEKMKLWLEAAKTELQARNQPESTVEVLDACKAILDELAGRGD